MQDKKLARKRGKSQKDNVEWFLNRAPVEVLPGQLPLLPEVREDIEKVKKANAEFRVEYDFVAQVFIVILFHNSTEIERTCDWFSHPVPDIGDRALNEAKRMIAERGASLIHRNRELLFLYREEDDDNEG